MIHPKSALYNYKCKLVRVIDGDTIHADVDLGFDIWKKVNLRLADIDAPEIRTTNVEEKEKGLKSAHLLELKLLEENSEGVFYIQSKGVDSFGRSIATIFTENEDINTYLLETGNAEKWVFNK